MTVNTARAILERLAFAGFLALLVGSLALTGLGVIFSLHGGGDARLAIFGIAGLCLVLIVRPLGYRHLQFRKWADSFEPVFGNRASDLAPVLGQRTQAFADTLANLEALLQMRAAGDGDVWAVQGLRHEAAAMLAAEPALREIFAVELAAHPELA